jgi:ficolin
MDIYNIYLLYSVVADRMLFIVYVYNSYIHPIVGDALEYHSGHRFSTLDQDNDVCHNACPRTGDSCALRRHGAWWYRDCTDSNLNGLYGGPGLSGYLYNFWYYWKTDNMESLKVSTMKVRSRT